MIRFNVPPVTGRELDYIRDVVETHQKLAGDGPYTKKCHAWFEERIGTPKALLTTSCTHALEMSAILADIRPGDEVIAPSYTFVSSVNAFVLRGATIVFVDIRKDTLNLDETLVEEAVTERTKAIVAVHYAGVSCEMDRILDIAARHGLAVVEDAAQGVMSTYKGRPLGTMGDFGCFSFHETKNYSCGEGGALLVRDKEAGERAEIIREKGTNRSKFFRGQVDKYSWVDIGSSYLPSELNAAYLYAQLESAETIFENRMASWNLYYRELEGLAGEGRLELPFIPEHCGHNAHMFYIKVRDLEERTRLTDFLKERGVSAVFHYIPLHSSEAGRKYGRMHGKDVHTTVESERLLRLPLYYNLQPEDVRRVCSLIREFYA